MRVIFNILILLLVYTSCNYQNSTSGSETNTKPDSVLIKSETTYIDTSLEDSVKMKLGLNDSIKVLTYENHPDWHVYVFKDYSRNSKLYNPLENTFNISGRRLSYVNNVLEMTNLRTNDSISKLLNEEYDFLLKNWVELHSLDSELFVVNACEFMGEYNLTDSLFYDGYFMDVPEMSIIMGITKINDNLTQLKLKSMQNKNLSLDFYQVDDRGSFIVVFSGKFDKDVISYMTTSDKVRNYNLIHHDCSDMTEIYEFDTPDYFKIIEGLRE